jgi:hypothetical protein
LTPVAFDLHNVPRHYDFEEPLLFPGHPIAPAPVIPDLDCGMDRVCQQWQFVGAATPSRFHFGGKSN